MKNEWRPDEKGFAIWWRNHGVLGKSFTISCPCGEKTVWLTGEVFEDELVEAERTVQKMAFEQHRAGFPNCQHFDWPKMKSAEEVLDLFTKGLISRAELKN